MFITFLEWIVPLLMVPIVAQRNPPGTALTWLVLIFFKPWIGLILYMLVGENVVMRSRLKSYCQVQKEIRSLDHMALQQTDMFRYAHKPDRFRLVEIAEHLSCMPVVSGNSVEVMDDGCEVVDRIISDIDGAQNHVHVLFYIYKDDKVGRRVADALARAASRGVECRVAVDAFGSRSLNRSLRQWMVANEIDLHTIMPVNPLRRHLTRLDLRNHRKLVIIDGTIGYTGSQNIEDQNYSGRTPGGWYDLMVRIVGPAVLQLQMVFQEDWYFAARAILESEKIFPVPHVEGDIPIQTVPSGPTDAKTALRDLLIAAINAARSNIIITSPYFVPDEPFFVALYLASLRGVSVDLIIPRHADHPVVGAVARAYLDELISSGVRIHFHSGVLHAKTMSIDGDIALVGTANFDHRSFYLHSELSLLLYGPEVTEKIRAKQIHYMEQSDALDPIRWSSRSTARKLRDQTLKLLSPLL